MPPPRFGYCCSPARGRRRSPAYGGDWIRDTRAVLPDSKAGPKSIQLSPPARAVLNGLPREGRFVFPNKRGDGPMTDLGLRWQKLRGLAGLDDVRIHDLRHSFRLPRRDERTGPLHGPGGCSATPTPPPPNATPISPTKHVQKKRLGRISGIVHGAMTGIGKEGGR